MCDIVENTWLIQLFRAVKRQRLVMQDRIEIYIFVPFYPIMIGMFQMAHSLEASTLLGWHLQSWGLILEQIFLQLWIFGSERQVDTPSVHR